MGGPISTSTSSRSSACPTQSNGFSGSRFENHTRSQETVRTKELTWKRGVLFAIGVCVFLVGAVSYGVAAARISTSDAVAKHCGLTNGESGSPAFVRSDYWPVSITCENPDGTTETDVFFSGTKGGVYVVVVSVSFGLFIYLGLQEEERRRNGNPGPDGFV